MLTFKQYLLETNHEAPGALVQRALNNVLNQIQQAQGNVDQLKSLKKQLEEIYAHSPEGTGEARPTQDVDPRAQGEGIKSRVMNAYRKVNKLLARDNPAVVEQINEAKTFHEITSIIDQYLQLNG